MADTSSYASDIPADKLGYLTLEFALPMLVVLIPLFIILNHPGVNGKFRLLYVWVITHKWANPGRGAWLLLLVGFGAIAEIGLHLAFGIRLAVVINDLFGLSVILVGFAMLLTVWGVIRWYNGQWRLTTVTVVAFIAAIILTFAFELCMIFLSTPRTFFGISAVMLSFQMWPMTALAFYASNGFVKSWSEYTGTVDEHGLAMGAPVPNAAKKLAAASADEKKDANLLGALGEAKKGDVVVAVPGASPAVAVADATPAAPTAAPSPGARYGWAMLISLYVASFLILIAYAILVQQLTSTAKWAGWATLGAIVALDIVVGLCVFGGKISAAWQISACLLAARILLIVWGAEYYFVGHCFLYFVAVVFFSNSIVESRWPKKKGVDGKVAFMRQLSVTGLALASGASVPAAAGAAAAPADGSAPAAAAAPAAADGGAAHAGSLPPAPGWMSRYYAMFAAYFDVGALVLLTAGMIADTIASRFLNPPQIQLQSPHDQWQLGAVVLFSSAVVFASQLVYRYYENKDHNMNQKLWLMTAALYVTIVVSSVLIWVVTKSVIVLASGCFVPPIIIIGLLWTVQFMRNDYAVLLELKPDPTGPVPVDPAHDAELAKLINKPQKIAIDAKSDAPGGSAAASGGKGAGPEDAKTDVKVAAGDEKKPDVAVVVAAVPPATGGDADNKKSDEKKDEKKADDKKVDPAAPKGPMLIPGKGPNGEEHFIYHLLPACGKTFPVHDLLMVGAIPIQVILIVMWGVTMGLSLGDQWWIGWLASAFTLTSICTVLAIAIWFNTFEASPLFILSCIFSPIFFFGSGLVFFVGPPLYKSLGNGAIADLFIMFLYPLLIAFGLGYYKWRDDKFVLSNYVKVTFGICAFLVVAFFIVIAIVFNWQVGVGGLVLIIGLVCSHYAIPVLKARFPKALHYFTVTVVAVIIAFAVIVAVFSGRGFVGFTIIAVCLCLYMLSMSYKQHRPDTKNATVAANDLSFFYSDTIFPVFKFQPSMGGSNPLFDDTSRPALVYANLALIFLWGVLAVFFFNPPAIGLGVSSLVLVLTCIYTFDLKSRTLIQLRDSVDFLVEGSALYLDVLEKAKTGAKGTQLSFKQKIGAGHTAGLNASNVGGKGAGPAVAGSSGADEKKDGSSVVVTSAVSVSVAAGATEVKTGADVKADPKPAGDVKVDVKSDSTALISSSDGDSADPTIGHLEQADSLLLEELETAKLGDWSVLTKKSDDLFASLPRLTFADGWSCKPNSGPASSGAPATVTYQGWTNDTTKLNVHDAARLYGKLERQADLLYAQNVKYHVHVQMELIVAANALRTARDREMELYLKSLGRADISLDELQGMRDTDPRKRALLVGLTEFREKQKKEAEARRVAMERKRKEESDAQAERDRILAEGEEDKRKRKKEEMEKLFAEQKAAEAAARDEAAHKTEEVAKQEFQVKAGKYEQAKKVYLDTRFKRWQRQKEANQKRVEADAERARIAAAALNAAASTSPSAAKPAVVVDHKSVETKDTQKLESDAAAALADAARYDEEAKKWEEEARRLETELKTLATTTVTTGEAVLTTMNVKLDFDAADRERRHREEDERKALEAEAERKRKEEDAQRQKEIAEQNAKREAAEQAKRDAEERAAAERKAALERERAAEAERKQKENAAQLAAAAADAAARAALEAKQKAEREAADRAFAEQLQKQENELRRVQEERARALAEQQRIAEETRVRLAAERKKADDERKAREQAQRDKENAERKERQRVAALEAEAAKKRAEEAEAARRAAAMVDPNIALCAAAVKANMCTYTVTGPNFTKGKWWKCETCNQPDHSLCETCVKVCHAGHKIVLGQESPFYCDCGESKCKACLPLAERAALEAAEATPAVVRAPSVDVKTPAVAAGTVAVAAGTNPLDIVPADPSVEIIASCNAKNSKYSDRDFPAAGSSLMTGKVKKEWAELKWKRMIEFDPEAKLFVDGVDPQDIKQGGVGDCWFMSSLSVLTLRKELFDRVFLTKEVNKAGVYSFRFIANGKVRVVTIDDNLPIRDWGPGYKVQLAMATSAQPHEFWPALLEKAYAKLYKGYASLESGFVDSALVDLTGGIGSRYDLTDEKTKKSANDGSLFNTLLEYHKSGFMLGAGSPSGSDSEANASKWGIVQGHAYSMLAVAEVDGIRLLQLRNPWGRKEWTGDWSDASPKWNKRMMAKVNYVKAEDGSFWMCWDDFLVHFEDIYVCRFFDRALWPHQLIKNDEWKGRTAGGCTNTEKVKDTPQYALSFTEPCTIAISLLQEETRGTGQETFPIAIKVYNNKGQRITRKNGGTDIAGNPEGFYFKRQVLAQFELPVQAEPYTVLFATHAPNNERKFTIAAYGTQPFTLEYLPLIG